MSADPLSTIRESLDFAADRFRNYDYARVFGGDYARGEALRRERLDDIAAARDWLRSVAK